MHGRIVKAVFAAAFAVTFAASVAAEPAKAPAPQAGQPSTNPPAQVLLASSEIRAPGQQSDSQAAVPAKRPRAARVTSCRCAGQTPQQP